MTCEVEEQNVNDDITKVGSEEAEDNSVLLYGIEHMRTGEANVEGKMYLGREAAGKYVKYTVMVEGVLGQVGEVGGRVVMNDVAKMDRGKVAPNGYLFVGSDYADVEVTVAAKEVEDEPPETAGESAENKQTAETTS